MRTDKDRKHDWANKPESEWTQEDREDRTYYMENRKPMRFQFGPDTTEADVDRFLDEILGPESGEKEKEHQSNDDVIPSKKSGKSLENDNADGQN
jgi:hypothetical protein